MNKQQFWSIIDDAKKQASDWEGMIEPLVNSLASLDVSDIMLWQQIFSEYQRLSYKNKLWAAAYVINGGCSDDGFDYFRAWLTAQGKDIYISALYDPETLAEIDSRDSFFEEMLGVAYDAYFKKIGIDSDYDRFDEELKKHLLSDIEKSEIASEVKYAEDMDANWNEDNLKELLPKLCEVFEW